MISVIGIFTVNIPITDTIITMTTLKLACLIFGCFAIIFILFNLLIEGQRNKYETKMDFIEKCLKEMTEEKANNIQIYLFMAGEFDSLLDNNLDLKRTHKAYRDFQYKFRNIIKEIAK